jgi:hypothetical protein
MPDARGEKRVKPNDGPPRAEAAQAIEHLSSHEQRTVSSYVAQVLERDPVVRTVLQQIGGRRGTDCIEVQH